MDNIIDFFGKNKSKKNDSFLESYKKEVFGQEITVIQKKEFMGKLKKMLKARNVKYRISVNGLEKIDKNQSIFFVDFKLGFSTAVTEKTSLNNGWTIEPIDISDNLEPMSVLNRILGYIEVKNG